MGIFATAEEIAAEDPFGRSPSEFEHLGGPSISERLVREAERRLGVRLPTAYLALLAEQNGGSLHHDVEFEGIDGFLTGIAGIGYSDGIDSDEGTGGIAIGREWEYPEGMVWLEGDGHTGFFLDYRSCGPLGEPPVVWLDSEDSEFEFVTVAPDFASFVRLIETYVLPDETEE